MLYTMGTKNEPEFTKFNEFASLSAGGKVLFATDDFFAVCENMLSDEQPIFISEKYTEFGKWMDGWETRRKRVPGHDWCIIKLATKCQVEGFLVDTAFFSGNYAPKISIQGATLTPQEEALIPNRVTRMGSASSEGDIDQIKQLKSDKWHPITTIIALRPGYEDTRLNFLEVSSRNESVTHIRVNIYPDGGIARLRVYGVAKPETPSTDSIVDLMCLLNGAKCQGYSNAHYGHPRNMTKPSKSKTMADGWETARRLDRPEILEANPDGTLKVFGEEWAIFKLAFTGRINKFCVDTAYFKGNFPDTVKIEGASIDGDWYSNTNVCWQTVLRSSKLSADKEHWFDCDSQVITHIRVVMAPDGGISRIKALVAGCHLHAGTILNNNINKL